MAALSRESTAVEVGLGHAFHGTEEDGAAAAEADHLGDFGAEIDIVAALQQDVPRTVRFGQPTDPGEVRTGKDGGDADGDSRRGATRHACGLCPGRLRDPRTGRAAQFRQVDVRHRGIRLCLGNLRLLGGAAEGGELAGRVDDGAYPGALVRVHRGRVRSW